MSGKVLEIDNILQPDQLACWISDRWIDWDARRQQKISEWQEIQQYVFATDTTKTTNASLPWSNKTTVPKLCQIRDNLFANYMASLFPKRKWLVWEGVTEEDEQKDKKDAIESYMAWVIDRPEFYAEVSKLVLDFIDYGNVFATVDWVDRTHTPEPSLDMTVPAQQQGYVGPMLRRISPLDIVFNPTAPDFVSSPKIIRSIVSLGEVKEILERESSDPREREEAEALYAYLKEIRGAVETHTGATTTRNIIYSMAGFTSFSDYLCSGQVEILTFYGDVYDKEKDEFLRNQVIKIVDRHKIISKKTNPSLFGQPPIYHAGWRIRPDNLWAMGPLDNLVGMQYRIDHLENMKADVFDLIAYPPLIVKGYVEDFTWGPFEKIYVGDDSDVSLLSPPYQALQADNQIAILEMKMEEMSGSPKEAMGFRTPGEKTKYEVQRLENAASRMYQNKISAFERDILELTLNAMLESSRRNMGMTTIRYLNEYKMGVFRELTAEDITGVGRIRPIAARHFADQALMVQNLNTFYSSAAGQDPGVLAHFSTIKQAKLWESLLDIEDFGIIEPFVRMSEQADAQRLMQVHQEQVLMESQQPAGVMPFDFDDNAIQEEPVQQ